MRKLLSILLLCPILCFGQYQAEWTFYGSSFGYQNGQFLNNAYNTQQIMDFVFRKDGTMVFSQLDGPITLFKNGKDYNTGNFVFPKEGAKLQVVKGGETRDAAAIAFDKNGNLWFGSKKGLHKIEARDLEDLDKMSQTPMIKGERFNAETNPQMPFNNVKIIRVDANGNLWVAGSKDSGIAKSEHKGISKFDGTTWTNLLITGLEDKQVKALVLDDQQNPIVVSQTSLISNAISWYKEGQWKTIPPYEKNMSVSALAYLNGAIYAGSISDVWKYENEKWEKLALKRTIFGITNFTVDKANNFWISSESGATCLTATGGEYSVTAENSPLPINFIQRIVVDDENRKWLITDAGILGYKEPKDLSNENMTVYTKFNSGLLDGKIESITQYKDGLLIVNGDHGLQHYDGKSFYLRTPSGLKELYHNNVVVDKSGNAYVATYRFLHKFDGTNYTKWDWKDDIGKQVNTVLVDNQDKVWIGFDGVSRFEGTAWQNYNKKTAGLSSNSVFKLFQDSKNNIWATLSDGVAKFDGTTWTSFTKKTAGVALGNMNGIAETKDGKILFSNGYKLIEFDGTAMKEVAGFKQVGNMRNMIVDEDGSVLFATEENGIAKFKDGSVTYTSVATANLPSNAISHIYRGTDGKLWVAYGLPPKTAFSGFGQSSTTTAATTENPRDAFTRKMKDFDSGYGLIELKKI